MSETRTVGTAILELLAAHDIDTVFGLPGVHNLAFWSAQTPVRIVGVRHEQAAVYAADGYGRATGRLGVALTTTGPGAVNALGAFGEAAVSGAPVLLISSDVSTALRSPDGPRGILHEMRDQAAPFAALDRPARTVSSAAEALAAVAEAIESSQSAPVGPSYLGIPSDILNSEWTGALPAVTPPLDRVVPDSATLDALSALLAKSSRPLIWAGGGVTQCSEAGESAVRALAERLGAPVVTTYAGRGIMAGHPLTIETSTHEPEVAQVIGAADLLIVIGSGFDAMHTKNWKMDIPDRRVAITRGDEITRTIEWDLVVDADLVAVIDRTLAELGDGSDGPRGASTPTSWAPPDLPATVRRRLSSDDRTRDPIAFVEAVESWPAAGVIVTDMSVSGYWTSSHARHPRTRRLLNPVGWGTLGYALPAAIGPAAVGIPTLAVCGDGGPMFALGELATYAQEGLPVTLLIVDDGGYGMLRFDQQVFGHPERGVDLATPDWRLLAAAFAIAFEEVPDASALVGALAAAADRRAPTLIVQRATFYPPASTSPRWFEQASGPRETA